MAAAGGYSFTNVAPLQNAQFVKEPGALREEIPGTMKFFPPWMIGSLVFGFFVLLIWQERRRPLRKRVEPDLEHGVRNLVIAFAGAMAMVVFEAPLIQPLARLIEGRHWGLLGVAEFPAWLEVAIALVLMDYTFYLWHVMMHRVPQLWRFHAVHHVDLDLDATTALRFHFGELLVSIPWRAAQVLVIIGLCGSGLPNRPCAELMYLAPK